MKDFDGFWFALARRAERIRLCKDKKSDTPSALLEDQEHEQSIGQEQDTLYSPGSLDHEMARLDQQNASHLTAFRGGGKHSMGKIGVFFMIIGFLIMATLFFASGYFYCYLNPPYGSSLNPVHPTEQHRTNQMGWSIHQPQAVHDGLSDGLTPSQPYALRQSQIQDATQPQSSATSSTWSTATQQSKSIAQQQAKMVVHQTLDHIGYKIRSALGYNVGAIVQPLTAGVAKKVLDESFPDSEQEQSDSTDAPLSNQGTPNSMPARGSSQLNRSPLSSSGKTPSANQKTSRMPAGRFTVQLQSFHNTSDAYKLVQELNRRGFQSPYIVRVQDGSRLKFYVRAGDFSNYSKASQARTTIPMPSRVVPTKRTDDRIIG